MTPKELRADIDESVRQFAQQIAERDSESTGIPRPAKIDISESSIELEPFELGLNREPQAEAAPGVSGGSSPPPPPPPDECALPDGDCPHSICAEFNLDEGDTADRDIVQLQSTGNTLGFYYEPADNTWNVYATSSGFEQRSMVATSPYGTWHRLVIQVTDNGDGTIHIQWSVDGVAAEAFDSDWDDCYAATSFYVGGRSGSGDVHRTIRLANLVSNPGSDTEPPDFNFPDDSFDSLVGATIDGDGNLRCDATDDDAYATHDTALRVICETGCECCRGVTWPGFADIEEINNIDITYTFTAHHDATGEGDDACPAYDIATSCTFNFVRIPYATPFGGGYQFKLAILGVFGGNCQLAFTSNAFSPTGVACEPLGPPADGSPWLHLLDILNPSANQDEGCTKGTINFCMSEGGGVETWWVKTTDPSVLCNGGFCSLNPGGGACVIEGIPWDFADMSVMRGTHSGENTCPITNDDDETVGTITIGIEIVIS